MTEPATDYSQIYEFLYRIDRRINYLEKDALFIEKKIISLEEKKSKEFGSVYEDLISLHSSIIGLKNNFTQCTHGMMRLSRDIKDTIKKEDIESLSAQMEDIKFEEYVTDRDLERGV